MRQFPYIARLVPRIQDLLTSCRIQGDLSLFWNVSHVHYRQPNHKLNMILCTSYEVYYIVRSNKNAIQLIDSLLGIHIQASRRCKYNFGSVSWPIYIKFTISDRMPAADTLIRCRISIGHRADLQILDRYLRNSSCMYARLSTNYAYRRSISSSLCGQLNRREI